MPQLNQLLDESTVITDRPRGFPQLFVLSRYLHYGDATAYIQAKTSTTIIRLD